MAKKRGLAANRGLDALLGSIKKEKQITASALQDDVVARDKTLPAETPDIDTRNATNMPVNEKRTAQPTETDTVANDTAENGNRKTRAARTINKNVAKNTANKNRVNAVEVSSEDQISLVQIDVTLLQAGKYQPRRDMSETALAELASSIEQHGVMQPIVIRPLLANEDKSEAFVTHEIIAGERRWRAAKMAGKAVIPAIERALSDELAIALALIENIQREDLSVIEQAAALQRFHTEFGMSHAMIAEVVGKARTTVSNLLRLNQLHDTVKD
ncbi:ParB/RepB/Spo0J family partition protein, partial [Psychrobacter sp.]